MRELVTRVLALTGSRSRIVRKPLPVDDPQRRRPDIGRAKSLLGWSPRVVLEDGLKRTIAHFAEGVAPRPALAVGFRAVRDDPGLVVKAGAVTP